MEEKARTSMIRIAISGPESTGKTTLATQLCNHFQEPMVAEYARKYLEQLNRPYSEADILDMCQTQIQQEDEALNNARKMIFCDTDMINYKLWLSHYNYTIPNWLEERITQKPYDLTLLLYPDIGWTPDPLREHPDKQLFFFHQFEEMLKKYTLPYAVIKGKGKKRFLASLQIIQSSFL